MGIRAHTRTPAHVHAQIHPHGHITKKHSQMGTNAFAHLKQQKKKVGDLGCFVIDGGKLFVYLARQSFVTLGIWKVP